MDSTDLVSPISLSHWDEVKLGHSDGALDGSLDFLVTFPSKTDVVLLITNNGVGFEASSLTSLSLLLDRFDFHNLLLEDILEEGINNLLLLDGDRESEDVNDVIDEFALHQSSEFGDGFPLNLFFLSFGSLSALLVGSTTEPSLLSFRLVSLGSLRLGNYYLCHNLQLILRD